MIEFTDLMLKPFLACLILTGIHAYLGLHVIKREVIFVDLALAQIAAFGATVGFLFGWGLHSTQSYFCSLAFTLVGAAIFAMTRLRKPIVPQEALIGIVYAVSAAASIIVLSRAAEGGEELKSLMVGHLLFIGQNELLKIFVLYAVIGAVHWKYRKQLLLISSDPERAFAEGYNVRLWDFLFYGTFGVIVTSSTEVAGVLLVFSFLIVPAVCGAILSDSVGKRLLIGWLCGVITSVGGLIVSYFFDFPTGATVVCAFAVSLLACWTIRALRSNTLAAQPSGSEQMIH